MRFTVAGPWWQRALRYVIGVVGLFAVWMGLRMIFPHEPTALGLALRMVRYALAMLWAMVGWPWLFVRIKLGTRRRAGIVFVKLREPVNGLMHLGAAIAAGFGLVALLIIGRDSLAEQARS